MTTGTDSAKNIDPAGTLYTIGHSTRTFQELVELLAGHGVAAIADVRLIPRSRRYPHFNDDYLAKHLPPAGIQYFPFRQLGGRRRPAQDSPNNAWRNESFRGYADFMQTPAFERALAELMEQARRMPTATMCAEAVPWRCHRSLIADALIVRGWRVLDIMGRENVSAHQLTSFARVEGMNITYPALEESDGLFK